MRDQAYQSLSNLEEVLKSVGFNVSNVVNMTPWITDADYMVGFNSVYREFFSESYPARSTLVSALALPDAMVVIDAIAYRNSA